MMAFLSVSWWAFLISLVVGGLSLLIYYMVRKENQDEFRYSGDKRVLPPKRTKLTSSLAFFVPAVAVFLIIAGFKSVKMIPYSESCALTSYGAVTGDVLLPGAHTIIPFVQDMACISTLTRSYETGDNPGTSKANFPDFTVSGNTADGQQVTVTYSVIFHVPGNKVVNILSNFGSLEMVVENVIKAYSRSLSRICVQLFTAEGLYQGESILAYQAKVTSDLKLMVEKHGAGVIMDEFVIRKIGFDSDYIQAIEDKQIQKERIKTAEYNAQQAQFEGEKQVTLSKAEAQKKAIQAEADANVRKIAAEADAFAMQKQGEMLVRYPSITQWEFISKLNGVNWGILPADALPLINIDKGSK